MQVLNVALGGTLLSTSPTIPGRPRHARASSGGSVHESARRRLAPAALDATTARCSCHHHQAVDRVGDGLRVTARGDDGVVEAPESTAPGPRGAVASRGHRRRRSRPAGPLRRPGIRGAPAVETQPGSPCGRCSWARGFPVGALSGPRVAPLVDTEVGHRTELTTGVAGSTRSRDEHPHERKDRGSTTKHHGKRSRIRSPEKSCPMSHGTVRPPTAAAARNHDVAEPVSGRCSHGNAKHRRELR